MSFTEFLNQPYFVVIHVVICNCIIIEFSEAPSITEGPDNFVVHMDPTTGNLLSDVSFDCIGKWPQSVNKEFFKLILCTCIQLLAFLLQE